MFLNRADYVDPAGCWTGVKDTGRGIAEKDLPKLAEDAMKQTRLLVNNPRELDYQQTFEIYRSALLGRGAAA